MNNPPVLLVGEALGEDEATYGHPFIGVSGHELYRMLEEARWLLPGTAARIIKALHPFYDINNKRWTISSPDFLPLRKTLDDANIFITNVVSERPPGNDIKLFFAKKTEAKRENISVIASRYPRRNITDGLQQLSIRITEIRPQLVIALGGTALWALTGQDGITKWRGSILTCDGPTGNFGIKCIPTFHPADILREWSHRFVAVQDFRRALRERFFPEIRKPAYHFIIKPSFNQAIEWLDEQTNIENVNDTPLVGDIETPYGWRNLVGHIACMGFATSRSDVICIPFMCMENLEGYWSPEQETKIVLAIRKLMTTRPMVFHKGVFECQHFARHWGFLPRWEHDTMVMQHTLLPGLFGEKIDPVTGKVGKKGSSLSLAFVSSMYSEYYKFWKEDGRGWNLKEIPDESGFWNYNCEDCSYTWEDFEVMKEGLHRSNLWEQYRFMMSLADPVLYMMLHGLPVDHNTRRKFRSEVDDSQAVLQHWINTVCGHELNTGSFPQMKSLFYNDLNVPPVFKGVGAKRRIVLDKGAMETISHRHPLLAPLCHTITDERSLAHFKENILSMRVSNDDRVRTEINLTGTASLRFASTETAFGEGLNLQNINRMPEE